MYIMDNTNKKIHGNFANKYTHDRNIYSVMTIKNMIKNYDNKQWHEDLQNKSTLKFYRKFKFTIQDEQKLYDNTAASTTLFEARSGTLRLNDRNRHTRGDIRCPLYVIMNMKTLNTSYLCVIL